MFRAHLVIGVAAIVIALALGVAAAVMDNQNTHEPLRNPYYPYSVELSVRDR